jgi:hypothetical protein
MNYFINNSYKQQLDSLMASYGLYSTITFSTRACHKLSTAIDNIFINKCKNKNYVVCPWINGLSKHDGQIMIIHNVTYKMVKDEIHIHRVINEFSILGTMSPSQCNLIIYYLFSSSLHVSASVSHPQVLAFMLKLSHCIK